MMLRLLFKFRALSLFLLILKNSLVLTGTQSNKDVDTCLLLIRLPGATFSASSYGGIALLQHLRSLQSKCRGLSAALIFLSDLQSASLFNHSSIPSLLVLNNPPLGYDAGHPDGLFPRIFTSSSFFRQGDGYYFGSGKTKNSLFIIPTTNGYKLPAAVRRTQNSVLILVHYAREPNHLGNLCPVPLPNNSSSVFTTVDSTGTEGDQNIVSDREAVLAAVTLNTFKQEVSYVLYSIANNGTVVTSSKGLCAGGTSSYSALQNFKVMSCFSTCGSPKISHNETDSPRRVRRKFDRVSRNIIYVISGFVVVLVIGIAFYCCCHSADRTFYQRAPHYNRLPSFSTASIN